jgi:hypothetical protein
MIDQTAMAIAARALHYNGAAWLIEREQLTVRQAARMFLSGASQDRGRVAAVVVLAAATWRHHVAPDHWNGDLEKAIAVSALDLTSDRCLFDHAAEMARKIVQSHLRAAQYRARNGRYPRSTGLRFDSLADDSNRCGARHPGLV